MWAWGFNGNSQVGNNTSAARRTPVRVCTSKTFCEIVGANNHVLAVEKDGRVWAWGVNATGQLANPVGTSALTPVSITGTVRTFCKIYTSNNGSLALDKYGKVWGWGANSSGQLGVTKFNYDQFLGNLTNANIIVRSPTELHNNKTFCSIIAKGDTSHALAIDYRGRVWGWGSDTYGQLGQNFNALNIYTPVRVCVI